MSGVQIVDTNKEFPQIKNKPAQKPSPWPTIIQFVALGAIAYGIVEAARGGAFSTNHLATAFVAGSASLVIIGVIYGLYSAFKAKKALMEKMRKDGSIVIHKKTWYQEHKTTIIVLVAALVLAGLLTYGFLAQKAFMDKIFKPIGEFLREEGKTIAAASGIALGVFILYDIFSKHCAKAKTPAAVVVKQEKTPPPKSAEQNEKERQEALQAIRNLREELYPPAFTTLTEEELANSILYELD